MEMQNHIRIPPSYTLTPQLFQTTNDWGVKWPGAKEFWKKTVNYNP